MHQDIARLRPAQVIPSSQPVDLVASSRAQVLAELKRGTRAGEYVRASPLRLVTTGRYAGSYAITVAVLDRPRRTGAPRWAKASLGAGATLLTLAGLGWWALASLGAAPLLALLVAVLVSFIALVRHTHGPRVTVTTTTTVSVR